VSHQKTIIGIVGGVGPYAGLDLAKKIFDNTDARYDQEHLDVLLVNSPRLIDDRSAYILAVRDGKVSIDPATDPANPGRGIVACIRKLAAAGAEVVGVPCNTAHSPLIFDVIERQVAVQLPGIQLLHLVRETVAAVCDILPQGGTIGLLATPGTYASGVYQMHMEEADLCGTYRFLEPDEEGKRRVRDAIYDTGYGIKAKSAPVTFRAIDYLTAEVWRLHERGVNAVIMGCTEIPLALDCRAFPFPLIDPAIALARALICAAGLTRLRTLQPAATLPPDMRRPWATVVRHSPPASPHSPSVATTSAG
jgi:aspartate racemase